MEIKFVSGWNACCASRWMGGRVEREVTMKRLPTSRKDKLKANLLELGEACPFHRDNPEDCPLFELRKLPRTKRLEWFRELSEEDLVYLTTYHQVCLGVKVGEG